MQLTGGDDQFVLRRLREPLQDYRTEPALSRSVMVRHSRLIPEKERERKFRRLSNMAIAYNSAQQINWRD